MVHADDQLSNDLRFQAVGDGPNPPEDSHIAYNQVGPGYFRTMKTKWSKAASFRRTSVNVAYAC